VELIFGAPTNPWVMSHPYGTDQPHVDAYAQDGAWLLVQPVHTSGQVTITFGKPTAGRLVLTGPGGGGGAGLADFTTPGSAVPRPSRLRAPWRWMVRVPADVGVERA
jgi:hypothetical protein